jgi:hypothetical protein
LLPLLSFLLKAMKICRHGLLQVELVGTPQQLAVVNATAQTAGEV